MVNKSKKHGNVAFKVTYTDSNWSGVCSPKMAAHNFKYRTWCSVQSDFDVNCQHPVYKMPGNLNKEMYPCTDCIAQKELMFYPGHYHSNDRDNEPISYLYIQEGKMALFTSKEPNSDESERFIFAVGQITKIENVQDVNGSYDRFHCDKETAIIFKRNRLKFWNYYTNENAPSRAAWNSLLFRYLDDDIVGEVLKDVAYTNRFPGNYRKKAEFLLKECLF
ncbi:hypothetical protein GUB10_01990 [Salegentibacter sp. BLCTC]|uniref:Uncharacterized protein n=1 Tax=Salegentibacter echinorum TaxID=1073325 RepID=A0A1M5FRA1_SALEC|nr:MULTISPECIES: hypothetical protein [Salegentibacter]MBE7639091.1 hypothetical protein [Salegentibacter sp. BLCTC]SHF93934.1 hypothetical protein SAMN05444483_103307 [Salegentibacter echinorum]